VWAQWRQTNRPSLYAIIGLKSMPAMQCGQRMIKIVSVRVVMGVPAPEQCRKARRIPDATPVTTPENTGIAERSY